MLPPSKLIWVIIWVIFYISVQTKFNDMSYESICVNTVRKLGELYSYYKVWIGIKTLIWRSSPEVFCTVTLPFKWLYKFPSFLSLTSLLKTPEFSADFFFTFILTNVDFLIVWNHSLYRSQIITLFLKMRVVNNLAIV